MAATSDSFAQANSYADDSFSQSHSQSYRPNTAPAVTYYLESDEVVDSSFAMPVGPIGEGGGFVVGSARAALAAMGGAPENDIFHDPDDVDKQVTGTWAEQVLNLRGGSAPKPGTPGTPGARGRTSVSMMAGATGGMGGFGAGGGNGRTGGTSGRSTGTCGERKKVSRAARRAAARRARLWERERQWQRVASS